MKIISFLATLCFLLVSVVSFATPWESIENSPFCTLIQQVPNIEVQNFLCAKGGNVGIINCDLHRDKMCIVLSPVEAVKNIVKKVTISDTYGIGEGQANYTKDVLSKKCKYMTLPDGTKLKMWCKLDNGEKKYYPPFKKPQAAENPLCVMVQQLPDLPAQKYFCFNNHSASIINCDLYHNQLCIATPIDLVKNIVKKNKNVEEYGFGAEQTEQASYMVVGFLDENKNISQITPRMLPPMCVLVNVLPNGLNDYSCEDRQNSKNNGKNHFLCNENTDNPICTFVVNPFKMTKALPYDSLSNDVKGDLELVKFYINHTLKDIVKMDIPDINNNTKSFIKDILPKK